MAAPVGTVDYFVQMAEADGVVERKESGRSRGFWLAAIGLATIGIVTLLVTMLVPPEEEEEGGDGGGGGGYEPPSAPGRCPAGEWGNAKWAEAAPGTKATGTCLTGYAGTLTRACGADGVWADGATAGQCTAVCPARDEGNAKWPQTESGKEARGTCHPGYRVNGTGAESERPSRLCAAGTWGAIVGPCKDQVLKKIDPYNVIKIYADKDRSKGHFAGSKGANCNIPTTDSWKSHVKDMVEYFVYYLNYDNFVYDESKNYKNIIVPVRASKDEPVLKGPQEGYKYESYHRSALGCRWNKTVSYINTIEIPPGIAVEVWYKSSDLGTCDNASLKKENRGMRVENPGPGTKKFELAPGHCLVQVIRFSVLNGWAV